MSRTTREINRITTAIISMSVRLLIFALVFFLMYEGITRGYRFGHAIFAPEAMEEAPGRDYTYTVESGDSLMEVSGELEKEGMIKDRYVFIAQAKFYSYDLHPGTYLLNSSLTSKEMLQMMDEQRTLTEDGAVTDDSE